MTIQNVNVYSRQALVSLLGQVISGYPDPENPQPPGPGDPVIRRALQRVQLVFGPQPEPWVQVALNPQPLPEGPCSLLRSPKKSSIEPC